MNTVSLSELAETRQKRSDNSEFGYRSCLLTHARRRWSVRIIECLDNRSSDNRGFTVVTNNFVDMYYSGASDDWWRTLDSENTSQWNNTSQFAELVDGIFRQLWSLEARRSINQDRNRHSYKARCMFLPPGSQHACMSFAVRQKMAI